MHVFLSYSHADKSLAARLRRGLEDEGIVFNDPGESSKTGTSWRQQVEEAIRSADAILLLLNSRSKVDEPQQLTWRMALEAVWKDPSKRWIPILLRDAKLPAFVRSGAADADVQAIRIPDAKDLGAAIEAILATLGISKSGPKAEIFVPIVERPLRAADSGGPPRPKVRRPSIEIYPAVTDEDRVEWRERLTEIRKYAEQLKH